MNQEFPVLEGVAPSWADVGFRFSITGAPLLEMIDIKSLSSGRSVEVGEQRGASGGRVLKRTTGAEKNEASATLYYDGFIKLVDALSGVAPLRGDERVLSLVHFDVQYQFTPPGSTRIYDRRLLGCRYLGDTLAASEGTDAQPVDIMLNPLRIIQINSNGEKTVLL